MAGTNGRKPKENYDVAILGGGLAGLTLAIQLRRALPDASIFVAERRAGPAPEAAFKVGESTVEIGARYFADMVGMRDHIEAEQLPKCALRFFFPAGDNSDIAERIEWGTDRFPPLTTYQLDRGKFENELGARVSAAGVDLFDGCRVEDVALGDETHTVTFERGNGAEQVSARWVVDAAGRAFFLKRKLGLLKDVDHAINSSWLRLKDGLDVESFSDDEAWLGRIPERGLRRLSTNHLMGEGYWVWLIPLSSGSTSIGIVADPAIHPYESIKELDAAIDWLNEHEPQVGAAVDGRRDDIEDFLRISHFAHGAERVFSADRWCLTGEAGVFVDPLYSPGSDFIATSNVYVTDLIVRDLRGEPIEERAETYNAAYLKAFENVISTGYMNHYPAFGNPHVMQLKLPWDYIIYWSLTALPFFYGKLTDPDYMRDIQPELDRTWALSERVQQIFRDWHTLEQPEWRGIFINGAAFPVLLQRHLDLMGQLDEGALRNQFATNAELLEALAVVIFHKAASALPEAAADPERAINPHAVSLDPDRWEPDGLFEGPGLTLAQAREKLPGLDFVMLETLAAAQRAGSAEA